MRGSTKWALSELCEETQFGESGQGDSLPSVHPKSSGSVPEQFENMKGTTRKKMNTLKRRPKDGPLVILSGTNERQDLVNAEKDQEERFFLVVGVFPPPKSMGQFRILLFPNLGQK